MPELDVALRELGRHVEFPPTPDLASAVRSRLERPRRWTPSACHRARRSRRRDRCSAGGAARPDGDPRLAGPARGEHRPRRRAPADSRHRATRPGSEVTLEEAPLWLRVPDDEPDSIYMGNGTVSLVWGTPDRVRLLLTEFRGQAFIEKLIEHGCARRARDGQRRARRVARGAARRVLRRPPRPGAPEHGPPRGQDASLAARRGHAAARGRPVEGGSAPNRAHGRLGCRPMLRGFLLAIAVALLAAGCMGDDGGSERRLRLGRGGRVTRAPAGGRRLGVHAVRQRRHSVERTSARPATTRTGSSARAVGSRASAAPGRERRKVLS